MIKANHMIADAVTSMGWTVFNSSQMYLSRPDSSWDGFHQLQTHEKNGGASKVVAQALLNTIC